MTEAIAHRGNGAAIQRTGFGTSELQMVAETASAAAAAHAQACFMVALQRPRNLTTVRTRLLAACKRPRFAEKAIYLKPVGDGVTGFSIRFSEEVMRNMGNLYPETMVIYDDDVKRVLQVSVTDLEVNLTVSRTVVISKTILRFDKKGRTPLGTRLNSKGRTNYILPAYDDEILDKQNAVESKALRGCVLRLLSADIQEDCWEQLQETRATDVAKDPDAHKKKIADKFAELGVEGTDLEAYLGHSLAKASPAEVDELRSVWAAIDDGEANWLDALGIAKAKRGDLTEKEEKTQAKRSGSKAIAAKLAAKRKAKTEAKKKAKPKAAEPKPEESTPEQAATPEAKEGEGKLPEASWDGELDLSQLPESNA